MSVDSWVGSYASAQMNMEKDFPTIAGRDLGRLELGSCRQAFAPNGGTEFRGRVAWLETLAGSGAAFSHHQLLSHV